MLFRSVRTLRKSCSPISAFVWPSAMQCGIPHMTFLPFRFQLLVLARFFALFPEPHDRNLELLRRWFWRISVGAAELGINGSQTDLRDMAACLTPGEESASVQRLLGAATLKSAPRVPDLSVFRATRADSKVVLTAMWNREPVDPDSLDRKSVV